MWDQVVTTFMALNTLFMVITDECDLTILFCGLIQTLSIMFLTAFKFKVSFVLALLLELAGECCVGQKPRIKKQAEMNAAKFAYAALIEDNELFGVYQILCDIVKLCSIGRRNGSCEQRHVLLFDSTVQLAGECCVGQKPRIKKQAEMNAAKFAYAALIED
nr:double-stranded RNA-binding [Tanacetum cinerariifolium]